MGEHCCSQDGNTCHCKPTGVSCGAAPVNISDALELVKEEVSAPTCTSGCNSACYNMGEHCCGQDGNTCHCRPIGVSCASEPANVSSVQAVVSKKLSFPTCTSGCNSACYNMGEHCCSQDGNTCHCKPTGVSCGAAPVNISDVLEFVKQEVSAPMCTSGCNSACYNMGEHCCSQDGTTCHCKPTGVSCAAEPDNKFAELVVVKDEVSAPACTSGCNSACYNMGEHCCGQDGSTCYCRPTGVSCASEPVDNSTVLALVQDEVSFPSCTSGCNAACYNMGEHCCSQSGNTCHCKPTGVSCSSGQSNASRMIDLVKEGSAAAFMTV